MSVYTIDPGNVNFPTLGAGDILYMRAGIYDLNFGFDGVGGTAWDSLITIAAYQGEQVIVRPSGGQAITLINVSYMQFLSIVFDGYNAGGTCILMTNPLNNHVRFQDCEVKNTGRKYGNMGSHSEPFNTNGITCDGRYHEFIRCKIHDNGNGGYDHGIYGLGHDSLMTECEIYRNAGHGIHKYSYGDREMIRRCRVYENGQSGFLGAPRGGGSGIGLYGGLGTHVENCLIYGNFEAGVRMTYGEGADWILNNTLYGNNGQGIDDSPPAGSTIENNIAYSNAGGDIQSGPPSIVRNNWIGADPRFVNPDLGDFRLRSDSPVLAFEALNLSQFFNDDFYGQLRS